MKISIPNPAHHRNGVLGDPFHAIVFSGPGDGGHPKVGVVFERIGHVAVLDIARLCASDVAFGSNSYRGDLFEPALRTAVAKHQGEA